ncbi:hypothetical protein SDC9_177098 [bioreactor metagenome]|uniref:Uncharacterized protein n=1 Tax=bioreactor metagenome TaxID=1076179 RepID=A0A645GSC9_9ZZZZ
MRSPNGRINHHKDTDVDQDSFGVVRHPARKIGDRECCNRGNDQVYQRHFEQTPVLCIPNDGGPCPCSAVDQREHRLQHHRVDFTPHLACQFRHDRVIATVRNYDRDEYRDDRADGQPQRRAKQATLDQFFLHSFIPL